ncbi:MAG: hypothetical protein QXU82_01160 [Candidatus Aenigmatarchaeota archaeon]
MAKDYVILGLKNAQKRAAKRRKGYMLLGAAGAMVTGAILLAEKEAIEKALEGGHADLPEHSLFVDHDTGYLVNETGAPHTMKDGSKIKFDNATGEYDIEGKDGKEKAIDADDLHNYLEKKEGIDFNILPYEMVEAPAGNGQGTADPVYQYEMSIPHSQMPSFVKHMTGKNFDRFAGKEKSGSGKITVKYDPETKLFRGDIMIDGAAVYENIIVGSDEGLEGFEHSVLGEAHDHLEDGKDGDHGYKPYLKEFVHKSTIDHMSHKLNAANEKITEYEHMLDAADKEADNFKDGNWTDIPDRIKEANEYIKTLESYLNDADKEADKYASGNWSDLDDRIHDMLDELDRMKDHIKTLDEKYTQNWNMEKDLFGQVYERLTPEEQKTLQDQGFNIGLMDDNETNGEMMSGNVQIIPTQDHSFVYLQKSDGQTITLNVSRALGEKMARTAYDLKGTDVDHHYGYTPAYLSGLDSHEAFVKAWETAKKNHWHKTIYKTDDEGQENETGAMDFYNLHRGRGVTEFDQFSEAWENDKIHYIEIVDTGDDAVNGGYVVAYDKNHKMMPNTAISIDHMESIREYFQGK